LVNGKLVTIEVIRINGADLPGRSLEKAIKGFSKYVAGEVRTAEAKPVELDPDANGMLMKKQLDPLIASRLHHSPSDVTILIVPELSDLPYRAFTSPLPEGSHVIYVHAKKLNKRVPLFVSHEKWAHLVIKHELFHTLGVPCERSHSWSGQHCTHPECILYPRVDARSVLAGTLRLGPPMDLCRLCRREIRRSPQTAAGKLIDPDEPYDRMKWLDEVVALNPTHPRAYMRRAKALLDQQNWTKGLNDLTKAIELDPNDAGAYAWRGSVYHQMGKFRRAISEYERSLQLDPDKMHVLNTLAWILATSLEDGIRDGSRAVELARRACELSKWQDPRMLGTLAAAYAETGQFDKAIEYQNKAISLVSEEKSDEYRQPLELYHQRTPRRDSKK
jgi:hypothetical protein